MKNEEYTAGSTNDWLTHFQNNQCNLQWQIINNPKFIEMVINIIDIADYRFIVNTLFQYYDTTSIEKKRKKKYYQIIQGYNDRTHLISPYQEIWNGIINYKRPYSEYENYLIDNNLKIIYKTIKNILTENDSSFEKETVLLHYFQQLSTTYIKDIIIDIAFQDNLSNVQTDISQIISLENQINKAIIKEPIRNLFKQITNINHLNNLQLIKLYHQIIQFDLSEILYDYIRISKNIAYNLIKNSLISKSNLQDKINYTLTEKNNVEIYELKGTPFFALVHATRCPKSTNYYKSSYLSLPTNVPSISYSLIDGGHLNAYRSPKEYVVYGYDDFDITAITHLYHADSYSVHNVFDNAKNTNFVNEIYTPESLMKNTIFGHNEIIIKSTIKPNQNPLAPPNIITPYPKYLLCYDEISLRDILYAQKHHLYIVLIHSDQYQPQNIYISKKRTMKYSGNLF